MKWPKMVTEADLDRLREEFYSALEAQTEALLNAITDIAICDTEEEIGETFHPMWDQE